MPAFIQKRWFQVFALAIVVLVFYSFALQNGFKTLDDDGSIVRNERIRDFNQAGAILTSRYLSELNNYYRPLVLLSYMGEYHFFGLNAFGYYVDNIILHFLVTLLVWAILSRLFLNRNLAFFAALLYATHPLQADAVTNVAGRSVILCTFFTFLSFWLFLKRKENRFATPLSLASFALALLSKEAAAVFPLVLVSYQFFLGRKSSERLRDWLTVAAPFFILVVLYTVWRKQLGVTQVVFVSNPGESLSGLLSFLRGLITYLRVFILPFDVHYDRSARFLAGFLNPTVFFVVVFYGGLSVFLRKWRQHIPAVAWFLLSWFAIELLPVSQMFVLIGVQPGYISLAEHFLYAALAGLTGLAALSGERLFLWNEGRRAFSPKFLAFILVIFYVYLLGVLIENNIYARNEIAMLSRSARLEPHNARVRLSLAMAYAKRGEFAQTESYLRRVLELNPYIGERVQASLAKSLCDQGKWWECLALYEVIPRTKRIAKFLDENQSKTLALLEEKYQGVLAQNPNDPKAVYALGIIATKRGEHKQSIDLFRRAVTLNPDFREAWFNLASMLAIQKQEAEAITAYERVVALSATDDQLLKQANSFLKQLKK